MSDNLEKAASPDEGPPEADGGEEVVRMQMLGDSEAAPPDGPYDPHVHRNRPIPTSNWETLVHLLKGSLGTGILAMPKAFFNAGLVVGVVATVFIGGLCTYCLHLLVRSQYTLCQRLRVPMLSYPKSMQKALEIGPSWLRPLAKSSGIIVDSFLIVYQLGICCVYIVFVAQNLKSVMDNHVQVLPLRLYMVFLLVPLVLINYIRDLKRLAPFSAVANVITFVGLGIILYYLFEYPLHPERLPYSGEVMHFPLFVGTTLFALEAVGVVIALENNMKTPKSFGGYGGVLNQGMVVIVFLYVFIGFFGYVRYGADSKDSVTLNLEPGGLTQAVQIIFAIAILITYALQSYVPVDIIWNSYLKEKFEKSPRKVLYEYLLRTGLVLITFILAVAIPNLGVFISLFGALCLSALGITFPGLMELCVRWPDDLGRYRWVLVKDVLLILAGVFALIAGTYTSILEIVKQA